MKWLKRFYLKIWNKLRGLVGKRKMEIEKTINRWFKETFTKTQQKVKPPTRLDLLCVAAFLCARKHSRAILLLIDNGHNLPTQALLRILCELYIKLYWCLNVSDQIHKNKEEEIYGRFKRWDLSRVIQHKKLLKNLQDTGNTDPNVASAFSKLESSFQEYKRQGLDPMPEPYKLFAELAGDWENFIYPKVYRRFSSAVHSDMRLIRDLVKYDKKNNEILCFEDTSYKIEELLKCCISMACDVNLLIRNYYDFDSGKIQNEYEGIVCKLSE